MKRRNLITAGLGLLLACSAGGQTLVPKTESFDTAASARTNGWWEWLTRIDGYDFGFAGSDHCGAGAGEAGGAYVRSRFRNGYADVFGNSQFITLDNAFSASGKMWVGTNGIDTIPGSTSGRPGIICGYGDWNQMGRSTSETRNTIGIQVSTVNGTIRSYLQLDTDHNDTLSDGSRARVADTAIMTPTYENVFDWSFSYDPNGGINSAGRLITTVTGPANGTLDIVTLSVTNDLTAAQRALGAKFNAFGIWNRAMSPEASYREGYFDDLSYLAITNDPVLPCIMVDTNAVVTEFQQTTNGFKLGIPPALYRTNSATITIISLDPGIAVPLGGDPATGVLSVDLAPGDDNVQTIYVEPTGTNGGSTTFEITNSYGVCVQSSVSVTVLGTPLPPNPTTTKTESFDSAASATADGWVEVRSRTDSQDFGFSDTANCGQSPGEAGGTFTRNTNRYYYADVSIGKLTLNDYISASGYLYVAQPFTNSVLQIGYFNSADGGNPNGGRNILGLSISEPVSPRIWAALGLANVSGNNPTEIAGPTFLDVFYPDSWSFTYDPTAGAAGVGQQVVTYTTYQGTFTITNDLTLVQRTIGATFDSFGLLVRGLSANTNDIMQLWIDNLSYSVGGPLRILGLGVGPANQLGLDFWSAAATHAVQATTSLAPPVVWSNVPGVAFTGPSNLVWEAQFPAPADTRFYRVVGNPSP